MTRAPETVVGRLIRRKLASKHMNQAKLATTTNISEKHLSQVITGKCRISPAVAAAGGDALGLSARHLLWAQVDDDIADIKRQLDP